MKLPDFSNLTADQKQSILLIALLLVFAFASISGAVLLLTINFVISFLLLLAGLFLGALAVSGYYIEFVEKD